MIGCVKLSERRERDNQSSDGTQIIKGEQTGIRFLFQLLNESWSAVRLLAGSRQISSYGGSQAWFHLLRRLERDECRKRVSEARERRQEGDKQMKTDGSRV